jgi:hypothetical protein
MAVPMGINIPNRIKKRKNNILNFFYTRHPHDYGSLHGDKNSTTKNTQIQNFCLDLFFFSVIQRFLK